MGKSESYPSVGAVTQRRESFIKPVSTLSAYKKSLLYHGVALSRFVHILKEKEEIVLSVLLTFSICGKTHDTNVGAFNSTMQCLCDLPQWLDRNVFHYAATFLK